MHVASPVCARASQAAFSVCAMFGVRCKHTSSCCHVSSACYCSALHVIHTSDHIHTRRHTRSGTIQPFNDNALGLLSARPQLIPSYNATYLALVKHASHVYGPATHFFLACGPMTTTYCSQVAWVLAQAQAAGALALACSDCHTCVTALYTT